MAMRKSATLGRGSLFGLFLLVGILTASGTGALGSDASSQAPAGQAGRPAGRTTPPREREHIIEGTKADDVLDGTPGDDWLFGQEGHDVLRGAAGNDTLDGATGDDTLVGGAGRDVLDGGPGKDGLIGNEDDDWLDGGDDEDTIDGGPGNDDLDGGDADDVLNGGAGDDTLAGSDGNDAVSGGDGADRVLGLDGDDRLSGGPGNDVIEGGDGVDSISAEAGADLVDGGEGDDTLRGGAGNDTLKGESGNDVLLGEGDNDTLLGSRGDDSLDGGDGHDTWLGGDGADVLTGGAGEDFLLGGLGLDSIRSGPDDDLVVIRAGDVGGGEIEFFDGGAGTDTLILIGFSQSPVDTPAGGERSLLDPVTGGSYRLIGVERVQHAHLFTHLGTTEKLAASFVFINPSRSDASSGRLVFFDSQGAPLPQSISGGAVQPSHAFTVPPLGRVAFDASGPAQDARGTALVLADRPLSGMLHTALPDLGPLVAHDTPLVDSFIVPVLEENATGTDTGVAIFSSTAPSTVKLTLRSTAGVEVSTDTQGGAEIEIPANGHRIVFVRDLFPWVGGDFRGAMTVEGGIDRPQDGGPLAGTGLQRESKAGAVSTFPVITVGPQPTTGMLHFATVPAGGDFRSTLTLVNPSSAQVARGTLNFFDQAGARRAVAVNGLSGTATITYEIQPMGSMAFATSPGTPATSGSARVTMTAGVVGSVLRVTSAVRGILSTGPSGAVARFITQVRRSRTPEIDTEVALSAIDAGLTLTLVLHDARGAEVPGGRAELKLPPNGNVVQTIGALFPKADTNDLQGTLVATAAGGLVAATAVEIGAGALVLKVVPVTPIPD
jgi:hypothetical protein